MQTLGYYNHIGATTPKAFSAALQVPEFDLVTGFHLVLSPSAMLAGELPAFLADLPDRPFDFYVSSTLTGIPDGDYLFDLRKMPISFMDRSVQSWNVPILDDSNSALISFYMAAAIGKLPGLFAKASTRFRLLGVSCNLISGSPYDTTQQIPNADGMSADEALADWATYGVTPEVEQAALVSHATAIAAIVDADTYLTVSFYNPELSNIGHAADGGSFYDATTTAQNDALKAVGRRATIFYPSIGEGGHIPEATIKAAKNSGSFAGQLDGGLKDPVAAAKAVLAQMDPAWLEIEAAYLPAMAAAGWDGSKFTS